MAANVLTQPDMPHGMLERVNELAAKRYALASWLDEREDALA
jgi:hypothetical protein